MSDGGPPASELPIARVLEIDQPPPFWGRWSRMYWLVGGLLAAEVVVFWLLTRWAA